MEKKIEIIDGQEIEVKVYAYREPKKQTAKPKANRSMKHHIRRGKKQKSWGKQ